MKYKIFKLYKRYKIAIISSASVILLGILLLIILFLLNKNVSIKKIDNKNYAFQYDTTWKLKKKEKNIIILEHGSGSKIIINISDLTDNYKFSSMNELKEDIIYNIQQKNKQYKLLSVEEGKITRYEFPGLKILFENGSKQIMIAIYKKSDKFISISYEASNDYFDILLDSVHSIINNLNIKDEQFNLNNKIKLNLSEVKLLNDDKVDDLFNDSKEYETADNHYLVEYSLPSVFEVSSFNSSIGSYELKIDNNFSKIEISVSVNQKNIYEYIDKNESLNVYNDYSYYKKNDDYVDFKENIAKFKSDYISYIYKNSFNEQSIYNKEYKELNENIELIYALDGNHILVFKIASDGVPITQKLIDMIKINKISNYASYIKVEKENNNLISRMKKYSDYSRTKIDVITLKIPDKYIEIDKGYSNLYLHKYFCQNYNEKMEIYDYDIHYELTTTSELDRIKTINDVYIKTTYGKYNYLTYSGNININGKNFRVYDGGYTDKSGVLFTDINRIDYYVNKKVLFYKMPTEGNLYIEIDGNNKDITNEILNDVTNFIVEQINK